MNGPIFKINNGEKFYYSPFKNKIYLIPNEISYDNVIYEEGFFNFAVSYEDVRNSLKLSLDTLVLEASQDCNMRCNYCIYSGKYNGERIHKQYNMDLNIAIKAIEYFLNHSTYTELRHISFYGGEPLINFNLIKRIVNKYSSKKDIKFSISTNGTLLIKYAQFFIDNNIILSISLDGPKEIHDSRRVFMGGKGSFNNILKGIEKIININEKFFKKNVVFSITLDNKNQLMRTYKFFNEKFPYNRVRVGFTKQDVLRFKYPKLNNYRKEDVMVLIEEFINSIERKKDRPFLNALFIDPLVKIFFRGNEYDGSNLLPVGFCIPGTRKLFINPNGKFYTCEKLTYDFFEIGNIYNGIEEENVINIIRKINERYSNEFCSRCWATKLCNTCIYLSSLQAGVPNKNRFEINCERIRKCIIDNLILYTELYKKLGNNFINFIKLKGGN